LKSWCSSVRKGKYEKAKGSGRIDAISESAGEAFTKRRGPSRCAGGAAEGAGGRGQRRGVKKF